jgi:pantoate--beta-alanine ligase
MIVATTAADVSKISKTWQEIGLKVGFVPTMGALHQGHISLVKQSKAENQRTIVSVFVNPNQFNNLEDLEKYPRNFDKDKEVLEAAGVDLMFFPSVLEVYPKPDSRQFNFGELEQVMEGLHRPGHFNGVAQVVSRLFEIVLPNRAYFGEKDFQQLTIIQQMVKQLSLPVEIIPCPILRESNGLAMSSRNELLKPEDRAKASIIFEILKAAATKLNELNPVETKKWAEEKLKNCGFLEFEYFEISEASNLKSAVEILPGFNYIICIAVKLGHVRLIDNLQFQR